MKFRIVSFAMAVAAMLAGASALEAQHAGFRTGIAPVVQAPVVHAPAIHAPIVHAPVQPAIITSPVQPFVSSPVTTFGVAPVVLPPIGSPVITTVHPGFHHNRPIHHRGRNRGVTIIVPNSTIIVPNNQVIVAPTPVIFPSPVYVAPVPFIHGPAIVVQQPAVKLPPRNNVHAKPHAAIPNMPAFGTPRQDVIRQFGHPAATIVTRKGETLYFNGGMRIFIQNGQVARPR